MSGAASRRAFLAGAASLGLALAVSGCGGSAASKATSTPLLLHPDNPRYFQYKGRPLLLVASGGHYGAVINPRFDLRAYLDALAAPGFTIARVFSGASFGCGDGVAPIDPGPGAPLLVPWKRGASDGYAGGGPRFNLDAWDPAYFKRLRAFVQEAGRRDIIVQVSLFSQLYGDDGWKFAPLRAANNEQGVGTRRWQDFTTLNDPAVVERQVAVTRQIVRELNDLDNLYYEVANEPESDATTARWHDTIIAAITETEAALPKRHLIALNWPDLRQHPLAAVNHGHYVNWAIGLLDWGLEPGKAVTFDETNIAQRGYPYGPDNIRVEAWEFLVGGGAGYNNLNWDYTQQNPAGKSAQSDAVRNQLRHLLTFMQSFDYVRMAPARALLSGAPDGARSRLLAEPGRQYALYLHHGTLARHNFEGAQYEIVADQRQATLALSVPPGVYAGEWIEPATGRLLQTARLAHDGGPLRLATPPYRMDIALRLKVTT